MVVGAWQLVVEDLERRQKPGEERFLRHRRWVLGRRENERVVVVGGGVGGHVNLLDGRNFLVDRWVHQWGFVLRVH